MIAFSRNLFRLSFTVMCVAGVILMVGYWIYKFVIEDRDVGVVDYEQWEKLAVEPPVVSLCIEKPFVIDKLKNITAYNPGGAFLNYLKGETSDDRFRNIDYEDVTINLKTYFLRGNILLSNESTTRKETARIHHKTVFNGFYFNDFKFMNFVKCFEISVSKLEFPNLLHVYYDYDIQKLLKNMSVPFRHRRKIFFNIYNRGQLTWAPNSPQQILMKSGENFQGFHYFIKRIEFLKSRKSRHHECLVEGLPGDMQILEKQIKEKGCRAPYHTLHKSLPLCNNITKLSEYASYGFYDKTRKETRPCQRISYLHYVNAIAPFDPVWRIDVRYPEDVKLISLTKQIDGHALIGNIGGYVGLLLGWALAQIPDLVLRIYDFLWERTNHLGPLQKHGAHSHGNNLGNQSHTRKEKYEGRFSSQRQKHLLASNPRFFIARKVINPRKCKKIIDNGEKRF